MGKSKGLDEVTAKAHDPGVTQSLTASRQTWISWNAERWGAGLPGIWSFPTSSHYSAGPLLPGFALPLLLHPNLLGCPLCFPL